MGVFVFCYSMHWSVTLVSDNKNLSVAFCNLSGHGQCWSALIGPVVHHASTESIGLLIILYFYWRIIDILITEIYFLACCICHNVPQRPWCRNVLSGGHYSYVKPLFHIWRWFSSFYVSSATVYEKGVFCPCFGGILWPSQKDLSLGQCKWINLKQSTTPK